MKIPFYGESFIGLTSEEINRLGKFRYEYHVVDNFIISTHLMKPFWKTIQKIVPRSIHPNILSLTGFFLNISTCLILSYYDPHMRNNVSDGCFNENLKVSIPSWAWFYCAFATLSYYALDNIDGIHARANNTCSSLGELLDHGVDVWNAHMAIMNVCTAVGVTCEPYIKSDIVSNFYENTNSQTHFTIVQVLCLFFLQLSHWTTNFEFYITMNSF